MKSRTARYFDHCESEFFAPESGSAASGFEAESLPGLCGVEKCRTAAGAMQDRKGRLVDLTSDAKTRVRTREYMVKMFRTREKIQVNED